MKRLSLTTLTLTGLLCLGVACSETDQSTPAEGTPSEGSSVEGMEPDPNAPMGTPDKTGETNPVVGENAGTVATPPSSPTGQQAGGTPTWIVYTLPG